MHVWERTFLLDLLLAADGGVVGARVSRWNGTTAEIGEIHARATVLATGGYGQVFAKTSNPAVATGDGLAAALRAGAAAADLEFVQFHPTVLALPTVADDAGRQLLVSEAVRGEGAVLIDADGNRVMAGKHPREDLAPRDVVAATMAARMAELGVDHLYLDARHLGEEKLLRRFPTIVAGCRSAGVDPVTEPIPVAPAAHYACGGVRSDMAGRTSLLGLYVVGEVACTGVHGANRLASNSLLEAMVVARRLARLLSTEPPALRPPAPDTRVPGLVDPARRERAHRVDGARGGRGAPSGAARRAGRPPGQDRGRRGAGAEPARLGDHQPAHHRGGPGRCRPAAGGEPGMPPAQRHRPPAAGMARTGGLDRARGRADPGPDCSAGSDAGCAVPAADPRADAGAQPGGNPMIPLPDGEAERIAVLALAEDLAGGIDVTTRATIGEDVLGTGEIVARADGVVCGLAIARAVFAHVDPTLTVTTHVEDGMRVRRGDVIAEVAGSIRSVLTGERSALNVLCLLSGVSTLTAQWVAAVEGTGAVIRDTRKTFPGLRAAQKYAVRCGGGQNHRMGLSDQALIKDNHVLAAGGVVPALRAVRALAPDIPCEVECTLPEQVEAAGADGAVLVLLDNMTLDATRASVAIARRYGTKTESSGGLRLENAREVAETGVDYLAVGALTHSAPTLDIALDLR